MKLNRKAAVILALTLVMTLVPLEAFAETPTTGNGQPAQTQQEIKNGVKVENGAVHYYENGNLIKVSGWKTINGAKYYGFGNGNLANKPVNIKTTYKVTKKVKVKSKKKKKKYKKVTTTVTSYPLYMFGADGKLIVKNGIYYYNGNEYYGLGGGTLKTGWAAFKENKKDVAAYFDPQTGAMQKGGKVKYLAVPASGRLGEAYALGVKKLDKTKWTLKQAYKNSYKLKYSGRWWRQKTAEQYAIKGFKKGKGNCYVMASTFYIQAKLLGYDVHQVKGKVAHIYPHSWTVINHDGKEWVYDPNFRNETKRNGWKIWYGKKGTWKYTNYSKMN